MRVEFLGTGGFHPNEKRQTACIMLPEIGLVFDAGTSTFRVAQHIQTESLDLFLTHAHLDHICGLTYLITLPLTGRIKNLRLHGRTEILDAVREHLFADMVFPVAPPFEFHELKDTGELTLPSGDRIEWMKLTHHPGGSTAFKLHLKNHVFAYVTDTTVDHSYKDFVHEADTLVHECYFPDSKKTWADRTGHTHSTPLANLAKDANVGRLIAVHIDPLDESDDPIGIKGMQTIFPNITVAEDGLSLDLI